MSYTVYNPCKLVYSIPARRLIYDYINDNFTMVFINLEYALWGRVVPVCLTPPVKPVSLICVWRLMSDDYINDMTTPWCLLPLNMLCGDLLIRYAKRPRTNQLV